MTNIETAQTSYTHFVRKYSTSLSAVQFSLPYRLEKKEELNCKAQTLDLVDALQLWHLHRDWLRDLELSPKLHLLTRFKHKGSICCALIHIGHPQHRGNTVDGSIMFSEFPLGPASHRRSAAGLSHSALSQTRKHLRKNMEWGTKMSVIGS